MGGEILRQKGVCSSEAVLNWGRLKSYSTWSAALTAPVRRGRSGQPLQWVIIRVSLDHVITALYQTIKMCQILYKLELSGLECWTKNFMNNRVLLI